LRLPVPPQPNSPTPNLQECFAGRLMHLLRL
jgi:hypothetical protein